MPPGRKQSDPAINLVRDDGPVFQLSGQGVVGAVGVVDRVPRPGRNHMELGAEPRKQLGRHGERGTMGPRHGGILPSLAA